MVLVRDRQVVQSVKFKHTNVIHWNVATAVTFFNEWAVDEIILLDVSRNRDEYGFYFVIEDLSTKCFVPLTVGGWITNIEEAKSRFDLGADKIVINSEAFRRPEFIKECAKAFGSQCVVVSIDVKRYPHWKSDGYLVCTDRGRELRIWHPVDWAMECQKLGAGEIFLNCIDNDGNRKGYNLGLLERVSKAVTIPVIAMGGVLEWKHLVDGIVKGGADAVAAANIFHYKEQSTKKAKKYMREHGIDVR